MNPSHHISCLTVQRFCKKMSPFQLFAAMKNGVNNKEKKLQHNGAKRCDNPDSLVANFCRSLTF